MWFLTTSLIKRPFKGETLPYKDSSSRDFFQRNVLTTFLFVNVYITIFYFYSANFTANFQLISAWLATPLILFLDNRGYSRSSRFIFILSSLLFVIAPHLGLSQNIYPEYYFISAIMLPAFIFEPTDKKCILLGMALCSLAGIFSLMGPVFVVAPDHLVKKIPLISFRIGNFLGASMISALFIKYFVDNFRKRATEVEQFFEISLDLLCIADFSGKFTKINPAFVKVLGHSENELLSKSFLEFVHPDDVAATLKEVENLKLGKKTVNFENRYRCKDGSYRILNWSTSPDLKTEKLYAVAKDITVIRQQERNFHQIVEAINQSAMIVTTDRNGDILSVNANFSKVSGYSQEELIGKNHRLLNSGQQPRDFFSNLWQTILGGKVWSGEIQNRAKDGRSFFVQTMIAPLNDISKEDVQKFIAISFDMTKKKESEQLLEDAQSVAKLGSWTYWPENHKFIYSHQLTNLIPISLAHSPLDFENFLQAIHPEDLPLFKQQMDEILVKGSSIRSRLRILSPNKNVLWIESVIHSQSHGNKSSTSVQGTCQDISELVTAEEKLKIERAKALHNAKLASLGEMSAGIAHEINNPLAIITGATWSIQKNAQDQEKLKEKIQMITKASDRIAKIVGGLKKFSRSSDHSEYHVHSISSIAKEALVLTEVKAKRFATDIILESQDDGLAICDEIEMEQVLINLINNSIDAVKNLPTRWVEIKISENHSSVVVRVRDSGHGITPEIQGKLFQPFFTTKGVGEGTGLGLSIVKGIIEEHGGSIEVLSKDPHTCFEIKLPKGDIQNAT
jgi:PAS domain S-box-containing protein